MISDYFKNYINKRKCTLLGVGPMSLNCINATIELANEEEVPIILIASRRQIDSHIFGGGYVNNWNTKDFSKYVKERDKKRKIYLARDHGGPWQNSIEVELNLDLKSAMDSAKSSFASDIDSGFQILHIDPSVDIHSNPNVDEVLNRIFELYGFAFEYAKKIGKDIIFEVGTEEQSGGTNSLKELDYILNSLKKFCKKNNFYTPTFLVAQTGTRVMEMRNVGSFDSHVRIPNELPAVIQIPKIVELCNEHGILMKEHNTDYLSNESLKWHPRLGIHAANVAPEFGVTETKALLNILEFNSLNNLLDKFLSISYNSFKWKKWMLENSFSTDKDKSIIAGHYVFSHPDIVEIKNEAAHFLQKKGIILDEYLKEQVKLSIMRYLKNFRIVR